MSVQMPHTEIASLRFDVARANSEMSSTRSELAEKCSMVSSLRLDLAQAHSTISSQERDISCLCQALVTMQKPAGTVYDHISAPPELAPWGAYSGTTTSYSKS